MTEIDWNALQKEASNAGILPDGEYNVIVTDSTAVSASTGKPMIKVKLRVTDGPQRDKPLWTQFVVSADNAVALQIFFRHMAAFGLDATFFGRNPSMEEVASNLRNRGARVTVGTRAWQGIDRNEIKSVAGLSQTGPPPPGLVTGPPSIGASPMSSVTSSSPINPVVVSPAPTDASPPQAPPSLPF